MSRILVKKFEEAIRRPVPYEGLAALSKSDAVERNSFAMDEPPQHREESDRLPNAGRAPGAS